MSRHLAPETDPYATYHAIWRAHDRYQRSRAVRRLGLRLGMALALVAWLSGSWTLWLVLGGAVLLCGRPPRTSTALVLALALGVSGCASQMHRLACAMGYRPVTIEGRNLCEPTP